MNRHSKPRKSSSAEPERLALPGPWEKDVAEALKAKPPSEWNPPKRKYKRRNKKRRK